MMRCQWVRFSACVCASGLLRGCLHPLALPSQSPAAGCYPLPRSVPLGVMWPQPLRRKAFSPTRLHFFTRFGRASAAVSSVARPGSKALVHALVASSVGDKFSSLLSRGREAGVTFLVTICVAMSAATRPKKNQNK
jgi:hypothetical protein